MARKRNRFLMEELEAQNTPEQDGEDAWVSRSQKKRNSTALQKMGEELVALPLGSLKKIPLNEDLHTALKLMARITDHEGRRRHMQYIGKLMRECPTEPIREALNALNDGHGKQTAAFHQAERLRQALLDATTAEIENLLQPWPQEIEHIQELVEQAKNESAPHAKRALFRKLHQLLEQKV